MMKRERLNPFKKRVTSSVAPTKEELYNPAYWRVRDLCDADLANKQYHKQQRKQNFIGTPKVLKLIPLFLFMFLAGCSNYDQMTQQRIQELQKEANVAQVACNRLEIINDNISHLSGYLNPNPKKNINSGSKANDSKPILEGYDCLTPTSNVTIYKEFSKDQVEYVKDCGAFLGIDECRIAGELNCLKKEH